jgi:hypothetical protein
MKKFIAILSVFLLGSVTTITHADPVIKKESAVYAIHTVQALPVLNVVVLHNPPAMYLVSVETFAMPVAANLVLPIQKDVDLSYRIRWSPHLGNIASNYTTHYKNYIRPSLKTHDHNRIKLFDSPFPVLNC